MITHKQQTASSHGFTIIESLIAIAVVGILMTAIAPVIVLSVGNRVQARRIELATGAARTYIDGVRNGTIQPPQHIIPLNEVYTSGTTRQFNSQRNIFADAAVPTPRSFACLKTTDGFPYCQNNSISSLYCYDFEGNGCSSDSVKDFVIQAFRSTSQTSTNSEKGYLLGVRVYRADAFSDGIPLRTQKQTGTKQATFTGGLGDRKAPLIEITTEISSQQTRLRDFCDRLGGCQ